MASKAMIEKSKKKPKFSTRKVRRCQVCGRNRGYFRYFDMCRICIREFANRGHLNGFFKSSK